MTNSHVATKLAAGLCITVSAIHWLDQGGLHLKDPLYMGLGYWALELAGLAAAFTLLTRRTRQGWALAAGVAAAPLVGFLLSRSTGLPAAMDDIGNWSESLGVLALMTEGALLAASAWVLARTPRPEPVPVRSVSRQG